MTKIKILVSDKLAEEGLKILKEGDIFQVDCKYDLKPEDLKKIIGEYDALIVRSGTQVTEEIIEAASRLKVIGRAGVGLDNVDLKAATKKGIIAMNTPGGNTTSTAEHAFSLIMALARNIPQAHGSMKAGKWERGKFQGVELYGKTLGVIGLGRIGSTVAKFAQGFGMNIKAYDPFLSAEMAAKRGIAVTTFEDLIKNSDFITIHVPKTEETAGMIGDKEIEMMKKSVRLVNCARGGIINETALAKALESKRIAGAALDVYDEEPPKPDLAVLKYDTCVLTPHLGASTAEAQVNVAIEVAYSVRDALSGKGIRNAANFPSLDAETYKTLEPYIDLGDKLGKFAGQLVSGGIQKIKITYSGILTKYNVMPVTMSLAYGVLKPILVDNINAINSLDIAKERGIDVQEIHSNAEGEFVNCVALEIVTDKETLQVWGTLSSNQKPRIVRVNNVYVEAVPSGNILFIRNNDVPGIVGAVGTALGDAKINIAYITFGREKQGAMAVSVVNVDSDIPVNVLEGFRRNKDILFVKMLKV
ncbi:MAG: phosphoglycerate dehydrogenase [Candidatus Omnitrophica bacterium]|nr:phosphoglycerate dehydrogenase [Candidatus Omnitrophota bacterium]